ncbi:unnamed protein product [Orchesella dallaii]|uniref:Transmembrane protein 208 n=1 Tax=Orchesella dallaii TaxID=48710 RepID=A0ABP1QGE3_9HEXA
MVVMTQKKGKEGTKGAKQIVEENSTTLSFYRNMIGGALIAYLVLTIIFSEFGGWDIFFLVFGSLTNGACLYFMMFMARATYSEAGGLLDSGVDLNMAAGIAEHVKDVIILTSACQVLSFFSCYFWLLWLLVPLKAAYYAWSKLIAPWVFAPAPEQTPADEKKQRKMERRMRR